MAFNGQPIAPKAPNLPAPKDNYDQFYFNQLTNSLRLYFNQLDNLDQLVAQRVNSEGILFPDGTQQTTAYVAGSIEAYDRSSSITVNSTPTLLTPANYINANNITYDSTTGVFTFKYSGSFSLALNVNAYASASNQVLYIYAQTNTGTGWVNNANSGQSYVLPNGQLTQIVYANAVTRTAGEQVRYFIYSSDSKVTLQTGTLPGVTPTVYVPAIRIQYSG